jgi:hypothetical protein
MFKLYINENLIVSKRIWFTDNIWIFVQLLLTYFPLNLIHYTRIIDKLTIKLIIKSQSTKTVINDKVYKCLIIMLGFENKNKTFFC